MDISLIVTKGCISRYAITTSMVLSPRLDVHMSTKKLNPLLKRIQQQFADAVADSFSHENKSNFFATLFSKRLQDLCKRGI